MPQQANTDESALLRASLDEQRQHVLGILDGLSDEAPAWWPEEQWPDWRFASIRQLVLHVVTETACHAGHLDAARELIDGRQWMVL